MWKRGEGGVCRGCVSDKGNNVLQRPEAGKIRAPSEGRKEACLVAISSFGQRFNLFYCGTHTARALNFPRLSFLENCIFGGEWEEREPAGLWGLSRVTKLGRENSCSCPP